MARPRTATPRNSRSGSPPRRRIRTAPPCCCWSTARARAASIADDRSRSRSLRPVGLVIRGDEAIEQAYAEGGGALRNGRLVLRRPSRAGDVEMCPWQLVDEALDEGGGGDAARVAAAADVLRVGGVAIHHLVVGIAQGHALQLLAGFLAGGEETLRQRVVVAEQSRMLVAERDDDGAGQGRQIDHQARLEAILAVPEGVAEG